MKPVLTHLAAVAIGGALVLLVITMGDGERPMQPRESTGDSQPHRAKPIAARTQQRLDRPDISGSPDISSNDFSAAAYDEFLKQLGAYRPTRAQLMGYIASRNGDPEAIFAAGLILGDATLLREAYEKDPDNPHYAFMLAARGDVPAEERLAMAQRLLELQPNNAIGSYLLAALRLDAEDTDAALDALRHAVTQPEWEDFAPQAFLAEQSAYTATGSTAQGAQVASMGRLGSPQRWALYTLAQSLKIDAPALSPTETHERRRLLAAMGTRMAGNSADVLVNELIGLGIQKTALAGLDDDDPSPIEGLTVAEANEFITRRRNDFRDNQGPDESQLLALPAEIRSGWLDRILLLGDHEANLWLRQQPEFSSQLTSDQ